MALNDLVFEDAQNKYFEGQDDIAYAVPKPQPAMAPSPIAAGAINSVLPGALPVSQTPLAPSVADSTMAAASPGEYVPAASPMAPLPLGGAQAPVQMTVTAPSSQSQTSSKSVDPRYQAQVEEATQAQKDAIDAQAKLEAAKAQEAARLLGEQQGAMQASYERQAALIQRKQEAYESGVTSYESAVKRYSEQKLVDPKEGQSFMQRIGAAIAVGLGAYGAAINRTSNFALDIINDGINRNIAQQKFQIEKLGVEAASKRSDLARLQSELGNADVAERAYRSTLMEKTKMQIDQYAAKSASDEIKAKAEAMKAALNADIAKENAKAHEVIKTTSDSTGSTSYTTQSNAASLKNSNEILEFNAARDSVMSAFDEGVKTSRGGAIGKLKTKIPSAIGGTKEDLLVQQAGLSAAVVGKVPGIRSDADYTKVIVPMLPAAYDSERTIEVKRKALDKFFRSYAPAAWLKQDQQQSPQQGVKNKFGFTGG